MPTEFDWWFHWRNLIMAWVKHIPGNPMSINLNCVAARLLQPAFPEIEVILWRIKLRKEVPFRFSFSIS